MAIFPPTGIQITAKSKFYLPAMTREPLETALENCNYLMQFHRPPLVTVCPTETAGMTRASTYIIPVMPSVDGLRYNFETRFACSAASTTVTVSVDSTPTYTAGTTTWTNVYSTVVTSSATAGALTTHPETLKGIDPLTTALRFTLSAPAAGGRTDHHLLCYPAPGVASAGIQASGATPFDGTLIAHTDKAAVHTEWLNRCKKTAAAVLTSRKQNCLSFAQEEANQKYIWSGGPEAFTALPPVRIWFPNQGPSIVIDLRVLAKVDAGVDSIVRVRQLGGNSVIFAANNSIRSNTLALKILGSGLRCYADVEVAIARTTGNTSRLVTVMGYYTPGQ